MRLPILFGLLSLALLAPPGLSYTPGGGLRAWLGIASAVLCLLYVISLWPERQVGRWIRSASPISWFVRLLLAPHRWGAWAFVWLKVRFRGERPLDEIVPGLFLGRRPLWMDRAANATHRLSGVVDLCVEFPESGPVVGVAEEDYLSIPALDGTAPSLHDTKYAVDWMEDRLKQGKNILVHCAAGHGRSATVVAALLIARGLATDAESAERLMKTIRPLVSLNRSQRRLIARYVADLAAQPRPPISG